jgi:hypothetical protein
MAIIMMPGLTQSPGALVAGYVDSRADSIAFVWIYNCTLVNENVTEYYSESVGRCVDGVFISFNGSLPEVTVLFAPCSNGTTGECHLAVEQWDAVRQGLFTNGIGLMGAAIPHPAYFPHTWPVSLSMEMYFDDNTVMSVGYTKADQLVNILYGTWSGVFGCDGWPEDTSFSPSSEWLHADGHLENGLLLLFEAITMAS